MFLEPRDMPSAPPDCWVNKVKDVFSKETPPGKGWKVNAEMGTRGNAVSGRQPSSF